MSSGAIFVSGAGGAIFGLLKTIRYRMVQVPSLCVPSGAMFVLGVGGVMFGLLMRFPIEWCKSRLRACLLVRFLVSEFIIYVLRELSAANPHEAL